MKYTFFIIAGALVGCSVGYGVKIWEFSGTDEMFVPEYRAPGYVETASSTSETGAPQLHVVNGLTHNFGTMEKNEEGEHTFLFRNNGESNLEIRLVRVSCKCTMSKFEKQSIEPGETIDVTLTWTPEDYSRSFAQVAQIKTNDPASEFIDLRVEGKVIQPLWAVPEELFIPSILSSEGFDETIHLFARDGQLDVSDVQLVGEETRDMYDVTISPLDESDPLLTEQSASSGVAVRVVAQPGLPLSPLQQAVEIVTNLDNEEPIKIPFLGTVTGAIKIRNHPTLKFNEDFNQLDVGAIQRGRGFETEVHLIIRGDDAADVEVTIDPEDVTPAGILNAEVVKEQTQGRAKIVTVRVWIPEGAGSANMLGPERSRMGRIIMRSNHPTDKTVEMFVLFAVTG